MTSRSLISLIFLVPLLSCGFEQPGITVKLVAAISPMHTASPPTVFNVTVSSIELHACPQPAWRHWLSPFGTAFAHESSSRLLLSTAREISLLNAGEVELGELHPAPMSICSMRVVFAPQKDTSTLTMINSEVTALSSETMGVDIAFDPVTLDQSHLAATLFVPLRPEALSDQHLTSTDAAHQLLTSLILGAEAP